MLHRWLYRYVRRRTSPIPEDSALKWKRKLSIAYGLCAWNAFGLVMYCVFTGKADWAHYYGFKSDEEAALPPGTSFANTLGIKNAKVYRISGVTKVGEYDIVEGKEITPDKSSKQSEELTL